MTVQHGKQRSPEVGQGSKRCKSESQSRSMGAIQLSGSEHGTYKIGTGGKDSGESNFSVSGQQPNEAIPGKIVSQLIEETEKQLAYYEQQSEILRERLTELKAIDTKE